MSSVHANSSETAPTNLPPVDRETVGGQHIYKYNLQHVSLGHLNCFICCLNLLDEPRLNFGYESLWGEVKSKEQ